MKSSDYHGLTLPIAPSGRLSISIPPDNPDYKRFHISSPEDKSKILSAKYPQARISNPVLQTFQGSGGSSQNGSPLASRLKISVKNKAMEVMNSVNSLTDQIGRSLSNASQGASPSNALVDQTYVGCEEEISTPLLSAAESDNMDEEQEIEDSLYDNG